MKMFRCEAVTLSVSDFRDRLMRKHLAIFFADRGARRCGTSTLFPGSIEGLFEKSCDKIAQPDLLTLLAIRSDERRKSRERTYLANAGEFNRRYLTCQISAILYTDRGDRRKSQSLPLAYIAIFCIKSPGVSPALDGG